MQPEMLRPVEINTLRAWLFAWTGLMIRRYNTDMVTELVAEKSRTYSYTWLEALDRELRGTHELVVCPSFDKPIPPHIFDMHRDTSPEAARRAAVLCVDWYEGKFPSWLTITEGAYTDNGTAEENSTEVYRLTSRDQYRALLALMAPDILHTLEDILELLRRRRDDYTGRCILHEPCPYCKAPADKECSEKCLGRAARQELAEKLSEDAYGLVGENGLYPLLDR